MKIITADNSEIPVSIYELIEDWDGEGYGIALMSRDDEVITPYIIPDDYPDMMLDASGNGAKVISGEYAGCYIQFHSGGLEEQWREQNAKKRSITKEREEEGRWFGVDVLLSVSLLEYEFILKKSEENNGYDAIYKYGDEFFRGSISDSEADELFEMNPESILSICRVESKEAWFSMDIVYKASDLRVVYSLEEIFGKKGTADEEEVNLIIARPSKTHEQIAADHFARSE